MFGSIFEEHISYAKALWAYNLMKDVLLRTVADIIHLIRFLTKHKPNQTIFYKMTSQSSNKFSNNLFAALFNQNKAKSTSSNKSLHGIFSMTQDEIIAEQLSAQSHLPHIPTPPPRASSSRIAEKATTPAQARLCQVKEKINS